MKLPRILAVPTGIALLVAAIGCSTTPVEVAPTPNIDATVEARLAQERAVDATVEARAKELVATQPTATPYPTYTPVPTATPTPVPTPVPTATPNTITIPVNTSMAAVFQQTGSAFVKKIHLESRFGFYLTVPFSECPLTEISPETEEAIDEIAKIIELEPYDPESWGMRGWAYALTHRYPQAINDLNKGIELSSSSGDVGLKLDLYKTRSFVYECTGELHKAEQDQENILELQQGDMWAYWSRAHFRGSHGQFELALNDINKFMELDAASRRDAGKDVDFDDDRVEMRADLLLASGRIGEAIAAYSSVIEWFYDDDDVEHYGAYPSKFGRGVAHLRRQQYEMAIDDFTRAMDDTRPSGATSSWSLPESVPFYGVARGIAYGMSGQFDEAIADFDKYIGEDQTYAIPYLFRGIALQTLGQSDLAEKDRAKACELDKELC